jgi:hypothetical protein
MLFELPSFDHVDVTDVEEAVFWTDKLPRLCHIPEISREVQN